jgi:DNA repair ATPase RecN
MATLAVSLARRRAAAARDVDSRVDAALASLCMPGARFRVALRWQEAEDEDAGDATSASARQLLSLAVPAAADVGRDASRAYVPTATGLDRATLLLSPAPGEPLRPLGAAASGGERARVMLALKAASSASSTSASPADSPQEEDAAATAAAGPPVSLFDEVDAGVGGTVGAAVGAALRRLAAGGQQVLCVTHLPQVAAYAERHVAVAKAAAPDGRPTSRAAALGSRAERAAELAQMLGLGADAGEQLLDAAAASARAEAAAAPVAR